MAAELPALDFVVSLCAAILAEAGAQYALIGGVAVSARGYIRTTADVDFLIHIERVRIPALLEKFASARCRFDHAATLAHISGREIARVRFQDVQIDLIPAVLPFFHEILRRATEESIGGVAVRTGTAEDLLVLKLLANRNQDKADVDGLLAALGPGLDVAYVRDRAAALLPAGDPRIAEFERRAAPPGDAGAQRGPIP